MNSHLMLFYVFSYLLLDIISMSLILPWLPTILESFEHIDDPFYNWCKQYLQFSSYHLLSKSSSTSSAVFFGGVLSSMFSLAQFVSSPLSGALSDQLGRKTVLIGLQLLSLLLNSFWACIDISFFGLVLSRFLYGITRANIGVLTALVGDKSSAELRTKGMTVVGLAYSLGFTVGPSCSAMFINYFLTANSPQHICRLLGISTVLLNLLNLIILIVFIPSELHRSERKVSYSWRTALNLINPKTLFSFTGVSKKPNHDKFLRHLAVICFLYLSLFSGIEYTIMFLAKNRFGFTSTDQGKMFAFIGILMMIIQGCLIRRFRFGRERTVILGGMITLVICSLILGWAQNMFMFYLGLALYSTASALFVPSMNGLVSLHALPTKQGQTLGIFRSLNALARVSGAAIIPTFFSASGPIICYSTCSVLVAVLCFCMNSVKPMD